MRAHWNMPNHPLNRSQRLFNLLQYLLPQHSLSRIVFHAARWRWTPWKNLLIRLFVWYFRVDLGEAESARPGDYENFNAFFTRALKPGMRSLDPDKSIVVSPIDGRINQLGRITNTTLIQAKGHDYSLADLLAGDMQLVNRFQNGDFATLYLSPRDYHRVHMPCDGLLQRMIHVPGRRFAVNYTSVNGIPNLFARNERLINIFRTETGPMALIMVGALFVGSIQTVWTDTLVPAARGKCADYDYLNAHINLTRGAEMGRFNMGSTVILLFPPASIQWRQAFRPESTICMGGSLGLLRLPSAS